MYPTLFSAVRRAAPGRPDRPSGPLAPELHERLQKRFGRVQIKKAGELVDCDVLPGVDSDVLHIGSLGELYYIRCPFCSRPGDDRLRAWVSYYYGQPHPITGRPLTQLAQCWNEQCFAEPGRSDEFELMLLGALAAPVGGLFPKPSEDGIRPSVRAPTMPGVCLPLSRLGPRHPAVLYAASRGFDPDELSAEHDVRYCVEAAGDYRWALNRLVIPIRKGGKLAGWQARRIDDVKSFKYYSMPGWHAGDQLYNFDVARQGRCIVLAEGVFDVWSIGPWGVALFGKNVSSGQLAQLSVMAEAKPLVVLLLDPKEAAARDKARAQLVPLFGDLVLPVVLDQRPAAEDLRTELATDQDADAGAMTSEAVWAQIIAQGDRQGIQVEDYI